MAGSVAVINVVNDIAKRLIIAVPDFWLLAGLTDTSFETGGSHKFRKAIETFANAEVSTDLIDTLRLGVNGNLQRLIEREFPHLGPLRANLPRAGSRERPDLYFGSVDAGTEAIIEVKAVYDMTLPKFYASTKGGVGDDVEKLQRLRFQGFSSSLFLLVYFLELPNYTYCAGSSYAPDWALHAPRSAYQRCVGVAAQYLELRKHLDAPKGMDDRPKVYKLPRPSDKLVRALSKWIKDNFRPHDPTWEFDPNQQFKDAAVGYAIWEF